MLLYFIKFQMNLRRTYSIESITLRNSQLHNLSLAADTQVKYTSLVWEMWVSEIKRSSINTSLSSISSSQWDVLRCSVTLFRLITYCSPGSQALQCTPSTNGASNTNVFNSTNHSKCYRFLSNTSTKRKAKQI